MAEPIFTPNDTNIWYTEYHTKNSGITFRIKETLYKEKTQFQELMILDTYEYGKVMLLDGLVMLTEKDEFIYHEMITHIPMHTAMRKKILIIGGGDCGTLREISKYEHIDFVKMVEIDGAVVEASKKFFPQLTINLSEKSEIIIGDGIDFVKNTKDIFDLIIIDSTDPFGPAEGLFTDEFYKNCYHILSENGSLVIQAETPYFYPEAVKRIYNRLDNIFERVFPYYAYIPTYPSGMWQFFLCNKNNELNFINTNISEQFAKDLQYFNYDILKSAFAIPNFVKKIYGL